jgi:3-methyladenine DNA glycosylase AlkD
MYDIIISDLKSLNNPEKAKILSWFFKTWRWEYWEWDKFLWIPVPKLREVAKKYFIDSSFDDIDNLMKSEYHEIRLTWFLILCYKYEFVAKKIDSYLQKQIVDFYLSHLEYWNNWDLVDLVCYKILWHYLLDKDRSILYDLANDKNIWKQRVWIVSTMIFVRKCDFDDALKISKMLLDHEHDLLHKAVWWVLREIWKKDEKVLKKFLDENVMNMDRTTLRYAIEKFDEKTRKYYLNLNKPL